GRAGVLCRGPGKRKSRRGAIMGRAGKLVTTAWLMLKNNEPYRYAKPETVGAKLNAVRRKAGEAPRGRSSREPQGGTDGAAVGRLNATYERAGLPSAQPPEGWTAGERRALAEADVLAHAEQVHQPPPQRKRPTRQAARKS